MSYNIDEGCIARIRAMEYIDIYQLSTLTGIPLGQLKRWTSSGAVSFLDCGKQKRYRTQTVLSELASMQTREVAK